MGVGTRRWGEGWNGGWVGELPLFSFCKSRYDIEIEIESGTATDLTSPPTLVSTIVFSTRTASCV